MTKNQIVVLNLIAFAVIHLILEAIIDNGNGANVGAPVAIQYLISYWIIKPKINNKNKEFLIRYSWIVSLSVLAVRIVLGLLFFGAFVGK